MFESGHLTLVSGAGEGEVVKKVGKEVRGARMQEERQRHVDVEIWSLENLLSSRSR